MDLPQKFVSPQVLQQVSDVVGPGVVAAFVVFIATTPRVYAGERRMCASNSLLGFGMHAAERRMSKTEGPWKDSIISRGR